MQLGVCCEFSLDLRAVVRDWEGSGRDSCCLHRREWLSHAFTRAEPDWGEACAPSIAAMHCREAWQAFRDGCCLWGMEGAGIAGSRQLRHAVYSLLAEKLYFARHTGNVSVDTGVGHAREEGTADARLGGWTPHAQLLHTCIQQ